MACLAALLLAAGCAAASPAPAISVTNAWVRPAAAGAETAAYLQITNAGSTDDALIDASSPVAASAMLHTTSTDASGMTGMSMIDRLSLPARGGATLQPGGTHLMLSGLAQPLVSGGTVELRLTFEHAGTIVVSAAVRPG